MLSLVLVLCGAAIFLYKAVFLGFPLQPGMTREIWNVETRIRVETEGKPVKVSLYIPSSSWKHVVVDEQFVSGHFGLVASKENGNRKATWSVRHASGPVNLYYQAAIRELRTSPPGQQSKPPKIETPVLEGAVLEATESVIAEIKAKSADTTGMVSELLRRLNDPNPDPHVALLLGKKPDVKKIVRTAEKILETAGIAAREISGIRLREGHYDFSKKVELLHWLEVYIDKEWTAFHPLTGEASVPAEWLEWSKGPRKLVHVEGAKDVRVTVSVSPRFEESLDAAVQNAQTSRPFLLRFSLFSLPISTQAVYRVMLLVPVGTLILVLLRNVVGIKTFGTFMPVLIALSFRETGIWRGILLFCLLIAFGLAIRFYLERLKLLLVPRLAAVLIVVVGLMAFLSLITHALGGHTGLSVALFPMVIITMTIERMSIVWEERGPSEALVSGFGSIVTAALAYVVMTIGIVGHLVFVFPELLLILLAAVIQLGRYTGYRLSDLYRFRAIARSW